MERAIIHNGPRKVEVQIVKRDGRYVWLRPIADKGVSTRETARNDFMARAWNKGQSYAMLLDVFNARKDA
jgi:hypothetical protein